MGISKRLRLSFLIILALFGLNALVQAWGNYQRRETIDGLRRAIARQALIATISQDVSNVQKQVALLSQVMVEAATGGASPDEKVEFGARLESIARQITRLAELSEPGYRRNVDEAATVFSELSRSWRVFYENFGVQQPVAISELAMRGDPLSQRFMQQMLPQLQKEVEQRVESASRSYDATAQGVQRFGVGIFLLSSGLAIVVAVRVSRYIKNGIEKVHEGAERIGSGDLDHRITVVTRDEFGRLARSFNEMAGKLTGARHALTEANRELGQRHDEVQKQQDLSESLLLNILPAQVARELRAQSTVQPRYFEDATILFTDFVGFGRSTENMAADELVEELHGYFTEFDRVVERYGVEKLKTIGDSYMCVSGLPERTPSHPVDMVLAALEMAETVEARRRAGSRAHWSVRIGIHTGPVIAGVVGIRKFAFDIWGESVNYASRMESSGIPNRVNISERTCARIKDFIACEPRGKVLTKEGKEADMYLVTGILPSLAGDWSVVPPPAFVKRYRVYFEKEPPAFPEFLATRPSAAHLPLETVQ